MPDLRQSTAVDVLIGPILDSVAATEEAGETIEDSDVLLSKNGQGLTAKTDVTTCAFDDHGCYNCELDATDTNTTGTLTIVIFMSGTMIYRGDWSVLTQYAWDMKYGGADGPILTGTIGATVTATTFDIGEHTLDDDDINGWLAVLYTAAGKAFQARFIDDFDGTTNQRCTVKAFDTNPTGSTSLYKIFPVGVASSVLLPPVDVTQWNGTAVATPDTAGYPVITIKDGTGTGELNTDAGDIVGIGSTGVNEIADALLDRATAIDGYTPRQILALVAASVCAKLSGADGTTVTVRSVDDNHDRVTATVTADGNRSAVTLSTTGI